MALHCEIKSMTLYRTFIFCIILLFSPLLLANNTAHTLSTTPMLQRSDVQKFIQQVAKKYHLDEDNIKQVMSHARLEPTVIKAMNRPYEAKPWYIYRSHFLTQKRIQQGAAFWQQHADVLAKAEKQYGVPASIIVAIIGVESNYGKQRGHFSVLNTLTTLAFEYPKRAAFFKKELAEFLVLADENGFDPTHVKGSYAGAIGQPQFMPSSYRHYAIDFAKNGQTDLFDNTADIIGSIANYLKQNGWKPKQPIAAPIKIKNHKVTTLANKQRETPYTVAKLRKLGISLSKTISATLPANILGLNKEKGKLGYWVGFHNFYVITRYNTSVLYAMAVYRLSHAVEKAHTQQLAIAKNNQHHS